jgi:hypothetical protein
MRSGDRARESGDRVIGSSGEVKGKIPPQFTLYAIRDFGVIRVTLLVLDHPITR